jgi:hypothetical protein
MRSCVAAPVAVIPSLLLSALSAALQQRARKLAVYSPLSAALPFLQGGASGPCSCRSCCLNPCDSICTANYQTALCALRFKPQAPREGQRAERASQSAGFIALCRWRHSHSRCRLRGPEISGSEQCTEMHRCLVVGALMLDGCIDGCFRWVRGCLGGCLGGGFCGCFRWVRGRGRV